MGNAVLAKLIPVLYRYTVLYSLSFYVQMNQLNNVLAFSNLCSHINRLMLYAKGKSHAKAVSLLHPSLYCLRGLGNKKSKYISQLIELPLFNSQIHMIYSILTI